MIGTLNADILSEQLRYYGVDAISPKQTSALTSYKGFDIVYGVGLLHSTTIYRIKAWMKKCLVHVVGSDAFHYASVNGLQRQCWRLALLMCDEILYVREELKHIMMLGKGAVIPIPIDTSLFRKVTYEGEKRDILYYCPNTTVYRLEWICQYAKKHPDETITILGQNRPLHLPNVKVCPSVRYHEMPKLYSAHRRLIRMTTHDGYPKMPFEALLCGLEVLWNGKRTTEVPREMLMDYTIPRLIAILKSLE